VAKMTIFSDDAFDTSEISMSVLGPLLLQELSERPQDLVNAISVAIKMDLGENPLTDQELIIILFVPAMIISIKTRNMSSDFLLAARNVYDYLNGSQYFHPVHKLIVEIGNQDIKGMLEAIDILYDQMRKIFEAKLASKISQKAFMSTFLSFSNS
jgi:hypothetical protein